MVRGFASDPNFLKWQLDLLPNGNSNSAAFLAFGETPGVFTYTLSTANLPAGQHALRLRVVRSDSNYTEYTTNFTIVAPVQPRGPLQQLRLQQRPAGTGTAGAGPPRPALIGNGLDGATAGQTTNGITAPAEGATVSGSVPVRGYANAANFLKWQLGPAAEREC